jgi:Lrp/AsnC family leucine-responsive transcriptional regulator
VKTTALDDVDVRIINCLVADGRATFARLGAEVGLSPHGAADRVRRLVAAGVITGFTATVDLETVGRPLEALVDVRLMPTTTSEEFERRVSELPTVRDLAFVTGRFDYEVRVACRDVDELDQTVRTLRQQAGAAQTETRIVLRSIAGTRTVAPRSTTGARPTARTGHGRGGR